MIHRFPFVLLAALTLTTMIVGCSVMTERRELTPPHAWRVLDKEAEYLKAHMLLGDVYILREWRINEGVTVTGVGSHLDFNRALIDTGHYEISIDSVAIFETNVPQTSGAIAALSVVTVASAVMTIVCLADPKACFGSCPTFYVDDGDSLLLQAEGFSSSVSPSLERTDLDALCRARFSGSTARLVMTNEAFETHVVRHADLLAAPKNGADRVVATANGEFWEVDSSATCARFGDDSLSAQLVGALDGREWFTLADSNDLAAKDSVFVEFARPLSGELGLTIGCRQTLVSTYLLYQTLAYMGKEAGGYLAALERRGRKSLSQFEQFGERLGNIEVCLADSLGSWSVAGFVRETGPLATDLHLVKLGAVEQPIQRLMLRFTKGYYRIDNVALVTMGEQVEALRLHPQLAKRQGVASDSALLALTDPEQTLVTFPGDTVELFYALPAQPEKYEYFLESRGYYLEWMRQAWLAEEDPRLAQMMLFDPQRALREIAPRYKRIEAEMEEYFWSSRYAR